MPAEFGPGSNRLWKAEISPGHSSPCVWGDRIYLTGMNAGELETLCIDRNTGEVLWGQVVPMAKAEGKHPDHSLATPTPACDAERVYVYFGSYGLTCYEVEDEELWQRKLPAVSNKFGTAASPMLAGAS